VDNETVGRGCLFMQLSTLGASAILNLGDGGTTQTARNNQSYESMSHAFTILSLFFLFLFFSAEWTPVSRQPLAIHMYTGYLARDIETKRKIWHEILRPKGKSDNQMRDLIQLSNLIHLFSYFVAISRAK